MAATYIPPLRQTDPRLEEVYQKIYMSLEFDCPHSMDRLAGPGHLLLNHLPSKGRSANPHTEIHFGWQTPREREIAVLHKKSYLLESRHQGLDKKPPKWPGWHLLQSQIKQQELASA